MDTAGNQYDKDGGYQTSEPNGNYLKAGNGLASSESEDLDWLFDDNFEVLSDSRKVDDTVMDMRVDSSLVGLGDEQNVFAYQPMRLLHITRDGKLTLKHFDTLHDDIPPYAVVSYASENGDVAYNDLKRLRPRLRRNIGAIKGNGWEKIHFCAQQAKDHGLNYFWIESCCVNRAHSSEVKQTIDATFELLKNAQTCYVLLSDVHSRSLEGEGESAFKKSTWFTHCYTFLDLVVPSSVEFFSRDGTRLGDRTSLLNVIQEAMGCASKTLSVTDLSLLNNLPLSDPQVVLPLSQRRRAICKRSSVYCLLGMFGCSTLTASAEDKARALEQLQKATQDKDRRDKIYRWLLAPDPSTNYRKALKQREPGTGLWFLNSAEFREWKDRVVSSRLWVQGTPGSGKTILSATVIENLQQHCHGDASMVAAYFYFDINDEQKQDARPMLRADVNAQGGRYGSALQAAASKGHLDVVSILLNNGADFSAQGGHFGSAINAARLCGHISIVDLILEFSKSNTGSNVAPSDSGYASQRQALSVISPSLPDPGVLHDSLTGNQSIDQTPGYCDEETYPDDIRSIQSDNESIGSKISTTRSRAELFAVNHLATFFAQLDDLRLLHEVALQKIQRRRFISNYRRILKSYYKRLLKEAASSTEKAVTRVLQSRRNRPSLEKFLAQPAEKEYLEDWLGRMQGTEYERSALAIQQPPFNDFQLEDGGSDSGFDTEPETEAEDEFTNIDGAERFLQQGLAFHNLVLDIRLLMLPHSLRQIVETTPKCSLQVIENNDTSWVNNAKAFLESHTGYKWDWWPLAPRIPNLDIGEQHLQWKVRIRNFNQLLMSC
ncbi:ankyrin repeat-containing domain protein [Curvularia clavata]|uniref:Ankyrin repeat-containing domain protein n=1 Tax=Curvularia clavata TaxID=95742 RepID=A0A9Q8ZCQ6_CURCL|nr:ankyrin repeat-containing domain protein [Curvularia clavata]